MALFLGPEHKTLHTKVKSEYNIQYISCSHAITYKEPKPLTQVHTRTNT